MSYTPNTWATGDTITASKLNNMEQGIANAGSAMIVTLSLAQPGNIETMNKTYAEIYEAIKSGIPCYIKRITSTTDAIPSQYVFHDLLEPIVQVFKYDTTYRIYTNAVKTFYFDNVGTMLGLPVVHVFSVTNPTDYPTFLKTVQVALANCETSNVYA